ncbi:ATP-binding protein [Conexibacter sp. SYSU D00693]|uniref:ATP-binding protein n=1 Tax=Conexibacter sp. SYSU D00693 TaxID=2812560 RepID=UPI00196A3B56|nr:ATP-binding protein [Conexibacter sp. SYSU D00693]
MRRLSLARTLRLALLGLTLVLTTIAGLGVASLYDTRQDYEERLAEALELQAAAARLLAAGVVEEATLRTATAPQDAPLRRRARRAFAAALADTRSRAQGDVPSAGLVADAAQAQAALRRVGAGTDEALAARRPVTELADRQRVRIAVARDDASDGQRRAIIAILVGGGLAVLAAGALVTVLLSAVRRPVEGLVRASGRLASGDLDARVQERGPTELREVARSFNAMAEELAGARDRLETQSRRLATMVASLGDGLIVTRPDGTVGFTNPRACAMVDGLTVGKPVSDAGLDLPDPEDARRDEVLVEHGDRTLALTAAVLEDGPPGVVWTLRDATERARLEALKSEFIATASHELRSPLTSIKGFIELLAAAPGLSDRHREFVEIVELSTQRLVDLVNDLLDVARLEAGFVEVHRRPTDLSDVVREVTMLLRGRIEEKGQLLDVRIEDGVPRAMADAARMRQVLTNLLTNAHQYTPEGGRVGVALAHGPHGVELTVSDTGRGMDEDELEHVFDRFSRASSSADSRGTGLGLAIVRSLVDLHEGRIDITSQPGHGTTFTVVLPFAPLAVDGDPAREALRGRRVLVVDDEPEIAELIAHRLEPYGVEATVAHSGADALDLLAREHFDALTVDVLMPGMSGFEVLRALREDPDLAHLPAVVVSVFSGREALSGEWHVAKPIDPEELADALGAAVLAGRVRVLACGRATVRDELQGMLAGLGIHHEWAQTPEEVERLCRRHRFEVALLDAGLPAADEVLAALDLRGRRLRRAVVVVSAGDGAPGYARLDADPVPLADAGETVLGLLGATAPRSG